VLARTRAHAARLTDELSRQRASLAAADSRRAPAGGNSEGLTAMDAVLAAAAAVTRAAQHNPTTPASTEP
jgi:hypothetical protein